MTCAVVLLLILPTACNPLDRLFQKQDTDPEKLRCHLAAA